MAHLYLLNLSKEDIKTISFVGNRYSWSHALRYLEEGNNFLAENEAWELKEAFEEDTGGNHSYFPMLNPESELNDKLMSFMDSIV